MELIKVFDKYIFKELLLNEILCIADGSIEFKGGLTIYPSNCEVKSAEEIKLEIEEALNND